MAVLKPDFAAQRKHYIFTDEHEQLRESIRRFVIKELQPHADEWEETTFPDWVFDRMGELGFLGLDKPSSTAARAAITTRAWCSPKSSRTPTVVGWRWEWRFRPI
jgi:alkylation response protein AidB-like acyl-CoA dehydrogenase